MAKGEQYKSRASEMRGSSGSPHRLGTPTGGNRGRSPMSKNSPPPTRSITDGKPAGGGSLTGKATTCPTNTGRKSESDAHFQKRMERHLGK